jgi:nucleoside-diphosphate-sugar epimerase
MPVSLFVTGASGFVGRALCEALRVPHAAIAFGAPDWEARLRAAPLKGATIYHVAARVHRAGEADEAAFERDNAGKTRILALEAAKQGARRIVFVSSIKVNGEETRGDAFTPGDEPAPEDPYGRSKLAAERALVEVASGSGVEWVVVRPPLVLGPGAVGNFRSLMRLADTPWPLPFAGIENRRSFVHVADLASLLVSCGGEPAASGRTFLAAHPLPWSTPKLVSELRRALGRPARLVAVPRGAIEAAAALIGRRHLARPLTRSLEVDASLARDLLGWRPALSLEDCVDEIARAWRARTA